MAKGIAHREWVLHRSDYRNEHGEIDDELFRQAVESENVLNVHIQERLGIAIISAPLREKIGEGYFTTGWAFSTATVPGIREPEPPDEPEAEPEPVYAGTDD